MYVLSSSRIYVGKSLSPKMYCLSTTKKYLKEQFVKLGVVDMSTNVLLGSSEHNIKIKISITYELATYIRATKRMEM